MNDGIRLAVKRDIPALCKIWRDCFSDSEEYIRTFYSENFERIKVVIYEADGKPVSMVNIFSACVVTEKSQQNAEYLYAVGTLKAYRGNGFMSAVLRHIVTRAKESEKALFLKPSSLEITEFYKPFGFIGRTYLCPVSLTPAEIIDIDVCDISCVEYNRMRDAAFKNMPYVRWDNGHIRWCIEENKLFSGKTVKIEFESKCYFLLGYPEGNTLIINETDLSLSQLKQLSGALCRLFGTENLKAYMPYNACNECDKTISSLLCNTSERNIYVNLIMM
ncbi:MAG: GNAT family N-acetyltransferase [Ruminococcaceae bacterium]|nr:GNAT family N-acetyltransferase [Oscillospiraceae bacterium]